MGISTLGMFHGWSLNKERSFKSACSRLVPLIRFFILARTVGTHEGLL